MVKIIICAVLFLIALFYPVLTKGKILFPSNLLMSAYVPWKYQPTTGYPNGPPNKPMGFDNIREFFPNRKLLKESFSKGIIPLWNPYIYSGVPFMASFDTAVWYPISWIAALFPLVDGWNVLVILQPILSLIFMFLFLKSLKFDRQISAYGAFVYAFSGWMIVYWQEILVLEHSFLWLPLALYASNRLWKSFEIFSFLLLLIALVSSVFGGFLQMSVYVFCTVILWNIYLSFVHKKINKHIIAGITLSILIACIQLIPSIEAFFLSPRGTEDGFATFKNGLLPLQNILTLIAPDYWGNPGAYNYFGGAGFYFEKMIYIGIVPLIFGLYGLTTNTAKTGFWKLFSVISLSMGFALPTSWLPYILRIPILSNSYPTRIFALFMFSAVILSCYGLHHYVTNPNRKKFLFVLVACSVVLILLYIVAQSPISLRNLVVPSVLIIALWLLRIQKLTSRYIFVFIMVLCVSSSFYFAKKYLFFSDRQFVYPELELTKEISARIGFQRVWGFGDAYIEKNIPQYFQWYSTDGYGNLSSLRYAELLSTIMQNGKLGGTIRRSDSDIFEAAQRDSMVINPYRLRIMSLLGVSYIVEHKQDEKKFPSGMFTREWENEKWRIWKYTQALPRANLVRSYVVKYNPQEIIDSIYDPAIDLSSTVILEENPMIELSSSAPANQKATIQAYGVNNIVVQTEASESAFLVLSDTYYPGWKAKIDGDETKIYRANYSFRAIAVPKGLHIVEFVYAPKSFTTGIVLSGIGLVGTILYVLRKHA